MKYADKEKTPPSVLFFDNHVLVAYKPAGLPTQPTPAGERSLEEWTKRWLKEETEKTGNVFLVPIHRLDKPVSGLVLFARSSKALARLNEQMRERKILKRYLAHIEGALPSDEGVLEHFLVHDDFRARVVKEGAPDAKKAVLNYLRIAPQIVEVELQTGRYHQIRAQLSAIGCPIVGDTKYGSTRPYVPEGIALQHVHLAFTHPVTQQPLKFSIPIHKRLPTPQSGQC